MNLYRINWKRKSTGISGNGTYIYNLTMATDWVEHLNNTCPDIHHWYE